MRLSGSNAPASLIHPLTGMAIEPLWVRPDGKVCWPMMGGAPTDDEDDEDKDKDKKDDTGDSGDGGDGGGDDGADDGDGDEPISRAEYDRLMKRMQAADRRASEAEKKIKEAEDAKKDDLTRASDELTAAQDRIKELEGTIATMRLSNSFLTTNKHTWHDPDDALDVAQRKGYLDGVVDEESGEVDKKALSAALDRLAKDKPYLVKSEKKDDDKKDKDKTPSGHGGPRRSDNNKDEDAKRAERRKRFPALQHR